MKIMIHCGAGNSDRPRRWKTINKIFSDLGQSLIELGHEVYMIVDPAAVIPPIRGNQIIRYVQDFVDADWITRVKPDCGITWNGNSDGDRIFVDTIGKDKMIYGELGFFGHYDKTCYFDRCGVNTRHSIIGANFSRTENIEDAAICDELQTKYLKSRLWKKPYIFVPLQDETDTQITQYSPFKTMDEFLHHVFDVYRFDDRDILYKAHPRAKTTITLKDPRVHAVTEDVHHYLPYADYVFGLNSTVMVETLLYHSRIITYGCGIASRHFSNGNDRQAFIGEMYRRQMTWDMLKSPDIVKDSYLYSLIEAITPP
jgi:hypothetical protein